MIKKKHNPTKQELQEVFHTEMSFEEAMKKIANTSKELVEKAIKDTEKEKEEKQKE